MKYSTSLTPVVGILALGLAAPALAGQSVEFPTYTVGPQADGSAVASTAQILTPSGQQVDLGIQVRVKAVALSPAAPVAAVLTMGNPVAVQIVNLLTGMVTQTFTPSNPNSYGGSFNGITFSADGSKIYYSDLYGTSLQVINVSPTDGSLSDGGFATLPLPVPVPALFSPNTAYPGGIALSSNGKTAYVTLSQNNSLGVVDLTQSPPAFVKQISVGAAPHSVVTAGKFAYVSNQGGKVAPGTVNNIVIGQTDQTSGTLVYVDSTTGAVNNGNISVVDTTTGTVVDTISVGLEPAGMTKSGNLLFVANTFSDSMSMIDLTTNKVIRTIDLSARAPDGAKLSGAYGVSPSSIAVHGSTAYVTLSTANCIAVVNLIGGVKDPVMGYIPTGYFPTKVAYAPRISGDNVNPGPVLFVSNDKGEGSRGSFETDYGVTSFNTHQDTGTASIVPLPNAKELAGLTTQVIQNNHWDLTANTHVGPKYVNPNATPVAIPEHVGEPSLIKNVFLIIRENRTYDQVFGNITKGDGDASLAVFGNVWPNSQALVSRFPLFDNFYSPSRQSADGWPWIVSAMAAYSDEDQSNQWTRSYPSNADDAMVYTPKSFLWQAAVQKGLNVKLYGAYSWYYNIDNAGPGANPYTWSQWYLFSQCLEANNYNASACPPNSAFPMTETSNVEVVTTPTMKPILDPHFPEFNLNIPDQYRVDYWLPIFQNQLATNTVPALTLMWIMCDHTAGGSSGFPIPTAEQADNDLAVGRIVDAISHSSIWGQSAIFIEEDDAQNGVDHVDGHRSPATVVSPYAVQYAPKADHTTYTALNMNRTIEQILGLMPLTQFDLVASPMRTAFTNTPNLTPFTAVSPTIPLCTGVGTVGTCQVPMTTGSAADTIEGAWKLAADRLYQGNGLKADAVDSNWANHAIWYAATDYTRPYPGEDTVKWPSELKLAATTQADADDAE